jgi:hypothetical protein
LPLQLGSGAFYRYERSYDGVERVAGSIGANDVVVADWAAYYAVRPKASKTYLADYVLDGSLMTDENKRRVNVMVIRPQHFALLAERIGGNWRSGPTLPSPVARMPLFARGFGDKLIETYDLQRFSRELDSR